MDREIYRVPISNDFCLSRTTKHNHGGTPLVTAACSLCIPKNPKNKMKEFTLAKDCSTPSACGFYSECLGDCSTSSSPLPSRRYTCHSCGKKGRRGNKAKERLRPPICPSCEKDEAKWANYYHGKLVEAQKKGYLPDSFSF